MSSLEQQLRRLSKEQFESLVHQVLTAKYPGAGVKKVEGSGGDEGIDSFSGLLDIGPVIWESKHFPDRIRDSQKRQISKSVQTAFKHQAPARWTLCLPINLRTAEHRWFQSKIVSAYGGLERIKLMQASDILTELMNNRPLRDAFFPENSMSDALKLRQMATNTAHLNTEERGALAVECAQQYLQDRIDLDPRLKAVVSIGGNATARQIAPQAGLVMSMIESERTTHFLARDVKEFNRDPLTLTVSASGTTWAELNAALDEGRSFSIPAGGLQEISSASALLQSLFREKNPAHFQLDVRPVPPPGLAAKVIPVRLVAGTVPTAKEIAYLPLRVARFGRQEIDLVSEGNMPVETSLKVRAGGGATLTMHPKLPGAEVRSLNQVLEFLDELERSGKLEVFSLEPAGTLLKVSEKPSSSINVADHLRKIIKNAALVAAFFQAQIRMPEKYYKQDVENLEMLRTVATGESFFDIDVSGSLIKNSATDHVLEMLDGTPKSIRIEHPAGWSVLKVFDHTIGPVPITLEAENATPISPEKTRESYLAAADGDSVDWKMHCKGPCRYVLGTPLYDASRDASLASTVLPAPGTQG
jgi:hypothetical protein